MKESIKKSELIELLKNPILSEQEVNNDETDLTNYQPQRAKYGERDDDGRRIHNGEGNVDYTGEYHRKMPIIKLRIPKVIDSDNLVPTGAGANEAKFKMKTINPRNNQEEEGYAVTDEMIETPNGRQLLLVKNYGIPGANGFTYNYIDASNERHFFSELPVKKEYGILKPDKYTQVEKSEKEKVGYSKRLISSRINNVFNSKELKSKLNSLLIANVVGDYRHTEMRTNVIRKMLWAVDSPKIDISYNGVVGAKKLEVALQYLMKKMSDERGVNLNLIPELEQDFMDDIFATGDEPEANNGIDLDKERGYIEPKPDETGDEDVIGQYKRRDGEKNTDYLTRAYPNSYDRGRWSNTQRVAGEKEFEKAGSLTPVRKLYSKDIQRGEIAVSSKSELFLKGDIVNGDSYSLTLTFDTDLAIRKENDDKGAQIGNIIPTIQFTITKQIPQGMTEENFSLGDSRNDTARLFFVGNDGIITEALERLRLTLLNEEQNQVIDKIMNIIAPKKSVNENKKQRIKLTEEQLVKLQKTINEEQFDDVISNFKRSQTDSIPVPHDNLLMLFNIAKDWCQGRPGDNDCSDITQLRDSLNLY